MFPTKPELLFKGKVGVLSGVRAGNGRQEAESRRRWSGFDFALPALPCGKVVGERGAVCARASACERGRSDGGGGGGGGGGSGTMKADWAADCWGCDWTCERKGRFQWRRWAMGMPTGVVMART